jgi:hypothetical protein
MRIPARRLPRAAKLCTGAALGALAAAALAQPSQALTILPHYDASITSLSNASAIQTAFNTVAQDYSRSFANPVTVNVNVSWGSVGGQALPSTAVGASLNNLYGYYTFSQIRSDLATFSARNPADTALASAMKSMPTTAPAGPTRWVVPSAEAKALGLISPTASGVDGSIGFAGSTSSYDFNPADGQTVGAYDFEAVAAHELAEVLGRISGISSTTPAWRTPFDLFRFSAPGVIDYGYNSTAYFSINGGVTNLKTFNHAGTGDRGDWASGSYDVDNAFISTGHGYALTAVDLSALDVLGWGGSNIGDTASAYPAKIAFSLVSDGVPEPSQWMLMIVGAGLAGVSLRRRRTVQPKPVRNRD